MSASDASARRARAAARRSSIVLHKARLGEEAHEPEPLRGADAVSLVTRLTRECWALMGETIPTLDRATMPVRCVSLDEPRREGG